MTFATCEHILPRIRRFLVRCGGPYRRGINQRAERNIILGLATGQFAIRIRNHRIEWFACWRRVDDVAEAEWREWPENPLDGSQVYILEAACRGNMREMVKAIRHKTHGLKGVMWHRPQHHDTFHHFPSQQGEGA